MGFLLFAKKFGSDAPSIPLANPGESHEMAGQKEEGEQIRISEHA
jgi:hypothetical protein